MTTECIVIHKTARDNLDELSKLYAILDNELEAAGIELYPVAISEITREYRGWKNINAAMGYFRSGKPIKLHPGDKCLFLRGKDWHMNKTDLRSYLSTKTMKTLVNFEIVFPEWPDGNGTFFIDIV
jgi:hypothetical protein